MNRYPHKARARRGSAAIEFGLVLPVLLAVFGAVIELSLYISTLHRVSRVARDSARVGSVIIEGPSPTGIDIKAAAESHALLALDGAGLPCDAGCTVTTDWDLDANGDWYFITVDVTYPYKGMTGFMPLLVNRGVQSRFAMVTQQQ